MTEAIHYDVIGDIHGRFDKLCRLMELLGYELGKGGFLPPPGRMALFLGDLIDPKPGHAQPGGVRQTLLAVKAMCDSGTALCLMGNHELNALYFHHRGPDGRWLRVHGDKNFLMHQGTLDDFQDYIEPGSEWQTIWLPWLRELPFYLDLGGIRAVHASWNSDFIQWIGDRNFGDEAFFVAGATRANPEGDALETLLKGVEVQLPAGVSFRDHTGSVRKRIRAKWWEFPRPGIRYDELVFPPDRELPNIPVQEGAFDHIPGYPAEAPPVFFGHYLKPADSPLVPECGNVACLDYGAAKDGPLVAYRWRGENHLTPENYFSQL